MHCAVVLLLSIFFFLLLQLQSQEDKTLFFNDGMRRIDYAFAYKLQANPDEKKNARRECFENNLRKSGLALEQETVQVRS